MKINRENIDIEKIMLLAKEQNELKNEETAYKKQVEKRLDEYDKQHKQIKKQMINLFHKGYWWSYDIDKDYKYPKKYSIKDVWKSSIDDDFYITVKEVFKKKPWPGFTGEKILYFSEFSKIDIYETEEEARELYPKRVCPKCGKSMGFSKARWCKNCMNQWYKSIEEFEKNHTFYCAPKNGKYKVGYEDEFTKCWDRGFYGKHFLLKRLDTGEVIETSNLWSLGCGENTDNLPEIIFLDTDSKLPLDK